MGMIVDRPRGSLVLGKSVDTTSVRHFQFNVSHVDFRVESSLVVNEIETLKLQALRVARPREYVPRMKDPVGVEVDLADFSMGKLM